MPCRAIVAIFHNALSDRCCSGNRASLAFASCYNGTVTEHFVACDKLQHATLENEMALLQLPHHADAGQAAIP
jgi:hypothetical protein